MARLRLDVDQETWEALVQVSLDKRRPVPWQAEVLLRQSLGLPFPLDKTADELETKREVADAGAR